ncbi:MAG: hypothetical protein GKR89_02165 [Candidatus Latescibacteria bacterium]|nr:hypothetical protein [Candidatus Latescibacterota bacterium]
MDNANPRQLEEDINFIRQAVEERDQNQGLVGLVLLWALVGLTGYALLDYSVRLALWFWAIAPLVGVVVSYWVVRRTMCQSGVDYGDRGGRHALHWCSFIGTSLAVLSITAVHDLSGLAQGQLFTLMSGIIWYFAGVHLDRRFMAPGLALVVGAIAVPFIPVLPWTTVGLALALSLIGSVLWMRPKYA